MNLLPPYHLTLAGYVKLAICVVGLLLLLVAAAVPSSQRGVADIEEGCAPFDPGLVFRGEFVAFFLLSLTGVMLCAGADDLVWLFLALELTSLPTYVMVAVSRPRAAAQESAVKYFFLGALAAAIFLYGFALIYGATGYTELAQIRQFVAERPDALPPLLITGMMLAVIGIGFKIAAVPMHFYVADVYQGAASPVSAFLAFVPKTAGFVSLILLLSTLGWPLPGPIAWVLWIMAAVTMTVGNVLGVVQLSPTAPSQANVKRILGYSSIAHSGYMLVALLAGPAVTGTGGEPGRALDGLAAILFYLVAYGLSNMAAFAVLGCLQTRSERTGVSGGDADEAQELGDISGLARREPALAAILLISMLSLLGLPPLVGFAGKIYLFGSAVSHSDANPEYLWLVVLGVLNSAISAVYYLRVAGACYFGEDNPRTNVVPSNARQVGAAVAAIGAIFLGVAGGWLVDTTRVSQSAPAAPVIQDQLEVQGVSQAAPECCAPKKAM